MFCCLIDVCIDVFYCCLVFVFCVMLVLLQYGVLVMYEVVIDIKDCWFFNVGMYVLLWYVWLVIVVQQCLGVVYVGCQLGVKVVLFFFGIGEFFQCFGFGFFDVCVYLGWIVGVDYYLIQFFYEMLVVMCEYCRFFCDLVFQIFGVNGCECVYNV